MSTKDGIRVRQALRRQCHPPGDIGVVIFSVALSDLSQRDEYLVLGAFPRRVLGESEEDAFFGTTEEQIAAAQLRVALDHKLGRNTQVYVRRLAGQSHALRVAAVRSRRMHVAAYACASADLLRTADAIDAEGADKQAEQ